ncbi:AAA family ATPase [Azospirillum sp. SYSU D00513]|uniref:AAA family ATPase n=1 Tax=Azospirillum sp. SYSU D00513 TaxID=2812561 RepID=UPI001A96E554|nr:AAA family ATPase [Azospirillum sp. SYSU D00513]
MKILALRGCNLASLDGTFEVELNGGPLRRAGLFAITGPTGAGKSTLLDALCLALFDQMPRLPAGRGVLLGREGEPDAINSTDVRTVLRRGATSGWAEVDFVGADGESYRARWQVRRARMKASGALQKQEMSLTSLDGTRRFGDGRSGVLLEIEQRLGLNFERFRRSVLLAQGDFASFLKAPAKERSELLELLTGTEIYSHISKAAFERCAAEKQALDALDAERRAVDVLTGDDRAALDAEGAALAATVECDSQTHEAARKAVAWHERDGQLARAVAEAETRAAEAETAWRDAEPRRAELAALKALQPLRALLADADRCAADAMEAQSALALAGASVIARRHAVEEATARHAEARRQFEQVCTEQSKAEPALERAAELDSGISTLAAEQESSSTDLAAAVRRSGAVAEEARSLAASREAAGREEAELAAWLSGEAALLPVAEQWGRWEAALLRYRDAGRSHAEEEAKLRRHQGEAERLDAELARHHAAQAKAAETQAEAEKTFAAIRAEDVPDLAEVSRRRTSLSARRDAFSALARIAERAGQFRAERTEAEAERAGQRAIAEREEAQAAEAKAAHGLRHAALDEAERTLRRFHLAQREDVETLRGQLTDGDPCPVCGGTDHPWATGESPLAGLLGEQERQVAGIKAEVAALLKSCTEHEAAARAARSRHATLGDRLAALGRELDALDARWADGAAPLDLPAAIMAVDAILGQCTAVDAELAEVAAQEAAALAHKDRCEAAAAALKEAERRAAKERAAVEEGQRGLAAARHAATLAESGHDRCAQVMEETLAELSIPFTGIAGWKPAVQADPEGFRTSTAVRVSVFLAKRQAQSDAVRRREELTGQTAAKDAELEAARQAEGAARRRADGLSERLGLLRAERAALLDGRPVAEVKRALADGQKRAQALVDHATIERQDAAARLSAAEQDQANRSEAARRCAEKSAVAAAALADAAAGRNVTAEAARARLSRGEDWLAGEEAALAEFETARRDAGLLVAERRRLRTEHAAEGIPAGTPEEARTALAETGARLDAARGRLAEVRALLEADARNRVRLAATLAAYEEQKGRHDLWATMSQLIGSAGGHKFRNFAQSLSLDMLLVHANAYLEDLARRYRLERVAGADLEIQVVDREMGDERRGVHSLSGGEMFLVSLALALGLSSMAAGKAGGGIGTLFIDEGFGTLDPESLDIALSCLEALQASGRQVGVISHVPALVDRIGVRVCVTPMGNGRSGVRVVQAGVPPVESAAGLEPAL